MLTGRAIFYWTKFLVLWVVGLLCRNSVFFTGTPLFRAKNVPKRFAAICMVLAVLGLGVNGVEGQSNRTVTFSGNTSDFTAAEKYSSVDNVDYYVTYDASYVYFGAFRNGGNSWGAFQHFTIYVDNVGTGVGSNSGVNWDGNTPTLPFAADYRIALRQNNSGESFYSGWNGSSWTTGATNSQSYTQYATASVNGALEVRVPWTDLGSPDAIRFLMYISNSTPSYYGYAPNGSSGAGPSVSTQWFGSIGTKSADCVPTNTTNLSLTSATLTNSVPVASGTYARVIVNTGTVTNANSWTLAPGGIVEVSGGTFAIGAQTITMGNAATSNGKGTTINTSGSGAITTTASSVFEFGGEGVVTGNNLSISGSIRIRNKFTGLASGGLTIASGGNLDIRNGGYVNSNPPTYASGSTLMYNSGTNYGISTEWTAGATSGAGYPSNVQISNNIGSSGLNFGASATSYSMGGTMNLASTTATLALSTGAGNLNIGGDWTKNASATFTTNSKTVSFNGTAAQAINSATTFYGLTIANTTATVTAAANITMASSGVLTINSSARFDLAATTFTITGATSSINGFLRNAGTVTGASTTTLTFNSGGTYEHNYTSAQGVIPAATWSPGSNCKIIGFNAVGFTGPMTSTYGWGQTFANFEWACSGQAATCNWQMNATTPPTITGTFTVSNTNGQILRLSSSGIYTLAIGGLSLSSTAGSSTLNLSNGATATINLTGDFAQTQTANTQSLTLTGGAATINFSKSSGTQLFSQSAGTISGGIVWNVGTGLSNNTVQITSGVNLGTGTGAFSVLAGSAMDFQTFVLSGSGTFVAASGSSLATANSAGFNTTGASGSVQTATRTFTNAGVSYSFNSGANNTGTAIGSGINTNIKSLTINNAGGVTVNSATGILLSSTGTLTFNAGALDIAGLDLTLTSGATISGFGAGKYVKTSGSGQLKQTVAASSVTFPVGNSAYNPVSFGNSGTSDTYGVRVVDGALSGTNDVTKTINRRWEITEAVAGGSTVTPAITFNSGEENNAGNFSAAVNPFVGKLESGAWTQNAATSSGSTTFTANSSFSPTTTPYSFAAGKDDGLYALPPAPTISSFSVAAPGSGTSGYVGTTITVTGSGFVATGMTVKIGGTAVSYGFTSSTTITITAINQNGTIFIDNGTAPAATSGTPYINLGYITTGTPTNWNTPASWLGGAVPAANSDVTIAHNLNIAAVITNTPVSTLTVNNTITATLNNAASLLTVTNALTTIGTGVFTFTVAGGTATVGSVVNNGTLSWGAVAATLNISAGGSLTNSGTFTGGSGTVAFAGSGTVTGTVAFNNLTLGGALTNPATVTVNGTLQLNTGATLTNSPAYGSSSFLVYNQGGSVNNGNEWIAGASGAGVPQNVTTQNSTVLTLTGGSAYTILGNVNIASGTLALSSTPGGNLNIKGNWSRTGTFTHSNRTVTFNGTAAGQTINNATSFYDIVIDNTSAAGVLVATSNNLTVTNSLVINASRLLDLNAGIVHTGSTFTVNGTLRISANGSVQNASPAPVYGSGSTLVYNSAGTYGVSNEWTGNSNIAGAGVPQDVTIQNSTTLNLPSGANLSRGCAGKFTISSGGATLGGNTTNDDLYVGGDLTNNGTFTHTNRAVFLNGTALQTIYGTFNNTGQTTNCLPYLIVNNGSNVSLGAAVSVTNTLTLTNGLLVLGANNLTLSSGGVISNAASSRYVQTNGAGQLRQTVAAANITYAVGNSAYNPITLNNTGGTPDTYGVNVLDGALTTANDATYTINRRWQVTEAVSGGSNLTATPQFNGGEENTNYTSGTTNYLGFYNGTNWSQVAATYSGSNPYTVSGGTFSPASLTSGTQYFGIGRDLGLLALSPPTISSFTVAAPGSGSSGYVGNIITVNGTNFIAAGMTVKVGGSGGTAVSSYTFVNSTQITFPAPNASGAIYIDNGALPAASFGSYTNLGYITTTGASNWNTPASWLGGAVPAVNSDVTIAHNLGIAAAFTNTPVNSITVNTGITATASATVAIGTVTNAITTSGTGVFTFSGAGGSIIAGSFANTGTLSWSAAATLNISAGGTLTNNGTFTRGTGTVIFAGAGTVNGSNAITFNNLTINSGVVALSTRPTIDGTFTINSNSGNISTNAPIYTSASTLQYNATYTRFLEWSATGIGTIGTTPGYPNNVTVSTGTLTVLNADAGTARALNGNLQVNTGATFTTGALNALLTIGGSLTTVGTGAVNMSNSNQPLVVAGSITNGGTLTLSTTSGGDLQVGGNFANNVTYTHNTRSITFNGTGAQALSGTLNGSGTTNYFPYLFITNTLGSVSCAVDINVGTSGLTSFTQAANGTYIQSAGTFTLVTGALGTINGTFRNTGATITYTGTMTVSGTGTYEHNRDGGVIPAATWNAASNCNILGMNATAPTGFAQTFGNFTWNCTAQSAFCPVNTNSFATAGTFSVLNTNNKNLTLSNSTTTSYTFNFAAVDVSGLTSFLVLSFNNVTNPGVPLVNVSGNVTVRNGGKIDFGASTNAPVQGIYSSILNVAGNLSIDNSSVNTASASNTSAGFYVGGNWYGLVVFNNAGSQTYNNPNSTTNKTFNNVGIDYVIAPPSTVTLNSNMSLYSSSSTVYDGISVGGTLVSGTNLINATIGAFTLFKLLGNPASAIAVTGFAISSGSNIISTTQSVASVSIGMSVTNANLPSNTIVADIVTGGTNYIVLNNAATGTGSSQSVSFNSAGSIITSNPAGIVSSGATGTVQTNTRTFNSSANYEFRGAVTGAFTTTPTAATVNNLSINNASNVSLSQSLTVNGALTFTNGSLDIGAFNLIMGSGSSIGSAGTGKYVKTSSTGVLTQTLATSTAVTFPIGNSAYNPITISQSGASDNYSLRVIDGSISGLSPNDVTLTINRRWAVTRTSSTNVTITVGSISYNTGEENNATNFNAGTQPYYGLYNGSYWAQATATQASQTFTSSNTVGSSTATSFSLAMGKDAAFIGPSNISISSASPSVPAGNIAQATSNNVVYKLVLSVTTGTTTLTGVNVTTAGTYVSADLTNLKCYYSTNATFSTGTSTLLSTLTTPGIAGAKTFPSFTNQSIPVTTAYLYITADVPCAATTGNTLSINAMVTADVTFANGTKSGTASAGGTQTIADGTPVDATSPGTSAGNGQLTISWTAPAGCYDEVMVVATDGASVTTVPAGNGSLYTASTVYNDGTNDVNLNANEFAIYKGSGTSVIMTGLVNGTTYNIKIFSRKGSNWSAGITTSGKPVAVFAGQFRSLTTGNWTSTSTWQQYNGSMWVAATTYPNSTSSDIQIQTGHTVTVNSGGPFSVRNLVVDGGGKLYTNSTLTTTNTYLYVYGDITCIGTIGNSPTYDNLAFNIEGINPSISGSGSFTATRIRKNTNTNAATNLTVAMDITTLWNATAIYNANTNTTAFNMTVNAGKTVNVTNGGSVSIHGVSGTGFNNSYGTYNINGTLTISGSLILLNSNTNALYPSTINIGATTGIINTATINAGASGASGGKLNIAGGGLLNITGTGAFTAFSTTNNTYTLSAGSTVQYSASGNQTVEAGLSYSNLTIAGTGIKSANNNVSVGNTLTLTSGSYSQSGLTTTVAAGGTVTGNGGNFAAGTAGGTLSFAGNGTVNGSTALSFNNLNINSGTVSTSLTNCTATTLNLNGGVFSIGSSNTFNIASGGTVAATSGDFATGTAGGILNFPGTGTFSGSSNPYNVYLSGVVNFGNDTVTIQNGGSLRINNGGGAITSGPFYANGSTLVYNTGATFTAGTEWYAQATSGRGVPYDVQVGLNGTNNTILDFGTSTNWRQCNNNITIGNSSGGTGYGLVLASNSGGDVKLAGNWVRNANGAFTPNNRAVYFVGNGTTQTITAASGSETFAYFIVNNPAGNVKLSSSPATSVTVNANTADVLQLSQGDLDLNGQAFTLSGSGGNINVAGAQRKVISATTANFNFTGSKTITSSSSGSLLFDNRVNANISSSVDFGAGLTTINEQLQINSGAFVSNNAPKYAVGSTLVYNAGGAFYNRGIEWGQATPLAAGYPHHVIVQNGTNLQLQNGGNPPSLEIGGDLTIGNGSQNGNVDMNAATVPMKINGNLLIGNTSINGSQLKLSSVNGADLWLFGNFTRWGTNAFNDNARATYFKGTGNATINTPGVTITAGVPTQNFAYARIDKTTGTEQITLNCPVGITNEISFTKGIINTTATNLLVVNATAAASVIGGSTSSYVSGPLRRYTAATTGAYLFPTGDQSSGRYKPVTFNTVPPLAAGDNFTGEYKYTAPPVPGSGSDNYYLTTLLGISNLEYWQFDRNAGSAKGTLTLPYADPGSGNWRFSDGSPLTPCTTCNVAIVKRSTSSGPGTWDFVAGSNGFSTSGTPPQTRLYSVSGDIITDTLTSFSPFTFGFGYNTILPVKLISFTGHLQGNQGKLAWQVANLADLKGFELQYSTDGRSFEKLAGIAASASDAYGYTHDAVKTCANFYRLKVNDKNGSSFYSEVVVLHVGAIKTQIIGLKNNPVVNEITPVILSAAGQQAKATITDALGRLIASQQTTLVPGQNQWRINAALVPLPGLYFITIQTADGVRATLKFVK
jgi:hypothetical protein